MYFIGFSAELYNGIIETLKRFEIAQFTFEY